jgi:hypothetical protein
LRAANDAKTEEGAVQAMATASFLSIFMKKAGRNEGRKEAGRTGVEARTLTMRRVARGWDLAELESAETTYEQDNLVGDANKRLYEVAESAIATIV